jgi:hypothetical protein
MDKYKLLQCQTPIQDEDGVVGIRYALVRNKDNEVVAEKCVPLQKLMNADFVASIKPSLIKMAETKSWSK